MNLSKTVLDISVKTFWTLKAVLAGVPKNKSILLSFIYLSPSSYDTYLSSSKSWQLHINPITISSWALLLISFNQSYRAINDFLYVLLYTKNAAAACLYKDLTTDLNDSYTAVSQTCKVRGE